MSHILAVENNEIVGAIGSCVDKLLCRKNIRKCKILGENYLGVKVFEIQILNFRTNREN